MKFENVGGSKPKDDEEVNMGRRNAMLAGAGVALGATLATLGVGTGDGERSKQEILEEETNEIKRSLETDPVVVNKAANILLDVLNSGIEKTIKLDYEHEQEYVNVPRNIVARYLDTSRDVRLAEVKERVFVTSEQRELTRQDLVEILSVTTK